MVHTPKIQDKEFNKDIIQNANSDNFDDSGYGKMIDAFFTTELVKTYESCLDSDDGELHARVERIIHPTKRGEQSSRPELLKAIMYRAKI